MKKLFLSVLFCALSFSFFGVDFDFSGSTAINTSNGISNDGKYVKNLQNSFNMTLSQNINFTAKLNDNIYGKTDISAYLNSSNPSNQLINFDFNELYIAWETEKSGAYYFGRKKHNTSAAKLFSFANVMGNNNASLEMFLTNKKWISFNGGLYYNFNKDFNNSGSLYNLNAFVNTGFFGNIFSINIYTYTLHCFDFPKGTVKYLFTNADLFRKSIKDFQNILEFVTVFTGNVKLSDFNIYGEVLIRTNPDKYFIKEVSATDNSEKTTQNLEKVYKNNFVNGTLGFSYDNSFVSLNIEYCYAMTGYNQDEIEEINKYLDLGNQKDAISKIRNGQTAFFKNNIGFSVTYNINENWSVSAIDKITFPNFGCDPEYIGTKFSLVGKFKYSDFLEFMTSIDAEAAAGGNKNEFRSYDNNIVSVNLGGKLSY